MWKHSIKIMISFLASTKWWIRKLELFSAFSLKQTVTGYYFHGCIVIKYIMRFWIILKLCSRIKDLNPRFPISNWPFSSPLMPLFQNESTRRTNLSNELWAFIWIHMSLFFMNTILQFSYECFHTKIRFDTGRKRQLENSLFSTLNHAGLLLKSV